MAVRRYKTVALSRGENRGYHREGGKIMDPGKGGSILVREGNNERIERGVNCHS